MQMLGGRGQNNDSESAPVQQQPNRSARRRANSQFRSLGISVLKRIRVIEYTTRVKKWLEVENERRTEEQGDTVDYNMAYRSATTRPEESAVYGDCMTAHTARAGGRAGARTIWVFPSSHSDGRTTLRAVRWAIALAA